MANKKKEVTKAPSGLKITRSGNKFTASWKIGDKDYGDGQYLQYLINDTGKDKWQPTADSKKRIGVKVTSKAISIDKDNFYPNKDKKGNNKPLLYEIGFRVKGNRKKYTTGSGKKKKTHSPVSSEWTEKRFTVNPPKKPTLTVELDEELTNVCKFSWSAPYASDDSYIFTDTQWQTILVKNNSETDGSKLSWKGSTFQEGTAGAESSKTITEDTAILYRDGNSYTRWFRVRARGPKGVSQDGSYGWVYKKHVYALPNKTNVTGTSAKETEEGGFQCIVDWTVGQSNNQKPIDKVTVQYTIVVPDENLSCPNGASWTDANISRDTADGDAAVFSIDEQLGKDQCLFIRVNTQHDSNITYGKPKLSSVGFLKDPTGLSVQTDNVTHKATINATNVSDVEDSVLVVRYVPAEGDPIDVGVIPHGSSSVTVQCPNWDEQTAIGFEVYAMVGTATKQTREDVVDSYAVTPKMRSQNTVSQGGAVPVAPKNVNVSRVDNKPDTVQVTWDWPWSEAGSAEISWSDHDDAWESTDEPESFLISNLHASKWNISGLETGKTWYVRVRLIAGNMSDSETVTYGPWSDISQGSIDLSSAPNKPVLILSDSIIPEDGSTTASWVYTTTDNTAQAYAEVAVVENGEYIPIAHSLTAQHVTIDAISAGFTIGNVYNLACMVKSASGRNSEWSDVVSVAVAEPLECDIPVSSFVFESKETNPREFEGNPIEFDTELNENIRKLEIALEPTQLGEGTPSPSNVRPIVGHSEVEAKIRGKNLFDGSKVTTTTSSNWDVSWENDELTVVHKNAYSTGMPSTPIMKLKGGMYCFSFVTAVARNVDIHINGSYSKSIVSGGTFTVSDGDEVAIKFPSASAETVVFSNVQLELGTTATDYVPYVEPVEIKQDFNVTLTPTVIDETPYLFKKTGDVRGDRESLELVGGTVNWNQLVRSPRYEIESDIACSGGTVTVQNGIANITTTGSSPYVVNITGAGDKALNHVYLLGADIKLDSANDATVPYTGVAMLNWGTGGHPNVRVEAKGSWIGFYGLAKPESAFTDNGRMYLYVFGAGNTVPTGQKVQITNSKFTDLTAFFCNSATADYVYSLETANAGAGIAWLRKYFPALFAYSPYDTGTLKSVKPTAHVTRGVNQWDEEWENGYFNNSTGTKVTGTQQIRSKNYIPVIGGTTYYAKSPTGIFPYVYDKDHNFLKQTGGDMNTGSRITNRTFTVPENACYMMFSTPADYGNTYNNDICINISNPDINGKYFPADHHTYPITELELRGIPKLVDGELRFDGDTLEPKKNTTNYDEVDLGTLNWTYTDDGSGGHKRFYAEFSNAKPPQSASTLANIICPKFTNGLYMDVYGNGTDKLMSLYTNGYLYVYDSAYTDANTFKSAMSGTKLVYEKATPTVTTGDYFTDPQEVSIYGTEEFVSSNGVPVGNKTTYKTRDIFGGTIDLASGVLTVDTLMIDAVDYAWAQAYYGTNPYRCVLSPTPYFKSDESTVISTHFKGIADDDRGTQESNICFIEDSYLNIRNTSFASLSDLNTFFEANSVKFAYKLATPQTYQLTPHEIETLLGGNTISTENGNMNIRIAESYEEGYFLTKMPLEATVTGIGEGGKISVVVERAEDYKLDRPDEDEFNGYAGETILQKVNSNPVIFETEDMTGSLDDGAKYNLIATIQDGLGQKAEKVLPFTVKWEHQALEPSSEIVIDEEQLIAKIRPIAPQGADPTDVADIYRLSADKPELIYSGATFGEWYVDPYPALGDMGGHRIVLRTKNGDYITADNQIAMVDSPELGVNPIENEEELNIIDFNGRQIQFYFDTDYSNTWAKDFQETQYLGGSIQGDWNPAVSRSGTLSSQAITVLDQEMLKNVRRLAEHSGICHVRTADGSSYAADVQVSEDRVHDDREMLVNYSLSITRVDSQGFDGMTLESWESEYPDEEEEPEEE